MEETHLNPIILISLTCLLLLYFTSKWFNKHDINRNLPPSPLKLPIIGNLHQVGSLPHHNLQSLARKHGPIMLLHFGEVMKTHDLTFANRPVFKAYKKLLYECKDVTTSPYGEYWRQVRSIFVLQLLSNKRVQSFHSIREEETDAFLEKIRESSGPVNLSNMLAELSYDGICRSAFGKKYSESENGKKFLLLLSEFMELLGSISIGDFVPWISWISRVNGFDKRLDKVAKDMDDILEGVIKGRIGNPEAKGGVENDGESFVDTMLEIYNDSTTDVSIGRDTIKALTLDVFVGGTDTVSTALEWAMVELLRHPTTMQKLQNEVRQVANPKQGIIDDDIDKMHYLKAVIKETLRQHPPAPLLGPRVASKDVNIMGYDISTETMVMINAWAIGRDPLSWDEPEKFKPERFLNSSIDFKGLDFEFIPFGAGRRGCPGITFAVVTMEFVLANLVQKFDWKLPEGVQGKDLDMSESPGVTVHKRVPLLAIASQIK